MLKNTQSIRKNTIANFVGFGYTSIIGIVVYPLYLQYLGAEAYGLVGFFTLMQSWLYMLDMGLSPTLARQISYARGQRNGFDEFIKLLRSLELIFVFLAIVVVFVVFKTNEIIAIEWINAEELDSRVIGYCIMLMGGIISLRFLSSLYKSGINGMEDHVWLNSANVILISLKFLGALALMHFWSSEITVFFEYQLLIGFLELLIIGSRLYFIIPVKVFDCGVRFYYKNVKAIAPFALGIAYTTGTWILLTQTDKLILSTILTLEEFGYFSIIALFSGGVSMLSAPITQALLPRMTRLYSEDRRDELIMLYKKASQISVVISFSAAVVLSFFSGPILFMMTGDEEVAKWGQSILPWFALGSAFLALSAFQFHLQNAYGDLKLHVRSSTLSVIIQTPIIYVATINFGAIGAGVSWFFIRFLWFMIWAPLVHERLVPGFHKQWLIKDMIPILVSSCVAGFLVSQLFLEDFSDGRLSIFLQLVFVSLVVLIVASMSSTFVYGYIKETALNISKKIVR